MNTLGVSSGIMRTRLVSLSLLSALSLVAACGSSGTSAPPSAAAANKKVAIVIAQGGLGDESYNDLAMSGFKAANQEKGLEGQTIESADVVAQGEPLLRRAEQGRAVFVSSSSSHSARPFWGLYAATKAALETMIKSYAGELSTTQVKANVFWPGAVRTGMRAKAMPGENPDKLPHPREVVGKLVDMVTPAWTETRMIYDLEKDEIRPL